MGTLNQATYLLVTFAVSLLFTGCGATEFGASTEMRDGKKAALVGSNGKADGADGADGADSGSDSGNDSGGGFGEDSGEDGLAGGGSDAEGGSDLEIDDNESSIGRCVYFVDSMKNSSKVEHVIDGGPPVKINLTEYIDGGEWDGDTFKFRMRLYRLHYFTAVDNLPLPIDQVPIAGSILGGLTNGPGAWHLDKPQGALSDALYEEWFDVEIRDAKSGNCYAVADYQEVDPVTVKAWHDSRFSGCFTGETQIELAGGKLKKASDIVAGDMARNPLTGELAPIVRITMAEKREGSLYHVRLGDKEVAVTGTHPFLTTRGVKQAQHLLKTDRIVTGLNRSEQIVSIRMETVKPGTFVYNFEMAATRLTAVSHILSADGIPAGDLWLQEENMHAGAMFAAQ